MQAEPIRAERLELAAVTRVYGGRPGRFSRPGGKVAVDQVSFTIEPGTSLGLIGQSGSGKSTLARMITAIDRPTAGVIRHGGTRVDQLGRRELHRYRRDVQFVFQDPYAALNPASRIGYILGRPLANYLGLRPHQVREQVLELLAKVGLTPPGQFEQKLPHQLSGGQRQRVVIARALASRPRLIVADEPVSMLDVSLRAGVLELLAELRRERGLSLLYITHDLLSARVITDELLVLYQGRIVERGPTKQVMQHPQHTYTVQLLNAVANPDRGRS